MDLGTSISRISSGLDKAGVEYAVIGGIAMAMRGVQRATVDLDLLLMLSDLSQAHELLEQEGYARIFHSDDVSHYEKAGTGLFRIDILHAFRGPSLAMLGRADRLVFPGAGTLPVLQIEDIVGLKIQALTNNPDRALGDWNDIHRLVDHAGKTQQPLDWDLIAEYLEIFEVAGMLTELKGLYETHF